jgi:hypothetical protein
LAQAWVVCPSRAHLERSRQPLADN